MWRLERFNENRPCYARHAQSFLFLIGFDPPTENWRTLNCRIDHAWEVCIHPVHGLSSAEVLQIVETCAFANVTPGGSSLKLHILLPRDRQLRGRECEFTVAPLATRRHVHNDVQVGFAF